MKRTTITLAAFALIALTIGTFAPQAQADRDRRGGRQGGGYYNQHAGRPAPVAVAPAYRPVRRPEPQARPLQIVGRILSAVVNSNTCQPVVHHQPVQRGRWETRTTRVLVQAGHWEIQTIPAQYQYRWTPRGQVLVCTAPARQVRVWVQPRYELRTQRVWVNY